MFRDALTYPVRDGGWIVILLGAVFSVVLDFMQIAPVVGLAVGIFAAGYFGSFYLDVVATTMTDSDRLPDWPGFTDFMDDILGPFVRLVGVAFMAFWPLIAVGFFLPEDGANFHAAIIGAVAYGVLYFPMAVLALNAFGGVLATLPHIVLPAIFRAMPIYLVAVVALVVAFAASIFAQSAVVEVPFVGWFVGSAVGLYSLIFQARLIGLIYRVKREALGWG